MWYGMVWSAVVWCGVQWCAVVWCGVECSGVEWSGVEFFSFYSLIYLDVYSHTSSALPSCTPLTLILLLTNSTYSSPFLSSVLLLSPRKCHPLFGIESTAIGSSRLAETGCVQRVSMDTCHCTLLDNKPIIYSIAPSSS